MSKRKAQTRDPKPVQVTLDKKRSIFYDLGAMVAIDEKYDMSFIDAVKLITVSNPRMRDIRIFLWGGLLHENPDLAEEDVNKIANYHNLTEAYKAIMQALTDATPEPEGADGENP